jgi:hypothetical protein
VDPGKSIETPEIGVDNGKSIETPEIGVDPVKRIKTPEKNQFQFLSLLMNLLLKYKPIKLENVVISYKLH